ncbi:MAG TPA: hypothetical protein H9972_09310 [Candidatus Paraprevotella stercorigallinarum]|nr:hypothetical protein [Candidatus Paraprevotella stercorigallinarum]
MKKKNVAVLIGIILVVCLIAFVGIKYAGDSSGSTQPAVSDSADEGDNDDNGDSEPETGNFKGLDVEDEGEINLEEGQGIVIE